MFTDFDLFGSEFHRQGGLDIGAEGVLEGGHIAGGHGVLVSPEAGAVVDADEFGGEGDVFGGAGEAAGILDSLLDRLATYQEKILAIKSKIKSALFYPISIVVIAFALGLLLVLFREYI